VYYYLAHIINKYT